MEFFIKKKKKLMIMLWKYKIWPYTIHGIKWKQKFNYRKSDLIFSASIVRKNYYYNYY